MDGESRIRWGTTNLVALGLTVHIQVNAPSISTLGLPVGYVGLVRRGFRQTTRPRILMPSKQRTPRVRAAAAANGRSRTSVVDRSPEDSIRAYLSFLADPSASLDSRDIA